jgi:large subunit ribosomal protein L4
MELKVINEQGSGCNRCRLPTLFGRDYNEALVHQVVVAIRPTRVAATASRRIVSEVAHTTNKPWRQKGTGRARAGMTSSPLWRGGGRSSRTRRTKTSARRSTARCTAPAWRDPVAAGSRGSSVGGRRASAVDAPKTKLLAQKLKGMGSDSVLVITTNLDENLFLSSRNLPNVLVLEAA